MGGHGTRKFGGGKDNSGKKKTKKVKKFLCVHCKLDCGSQKGQIRHERNCKSNPANRATRSFEQQPDSSDSHHWY